VRCFGGNHGGALGDPDSAEIGDDELPSSVPVLELGGLSGAVLGGWYHSCALRRNGHVRCWGSGKDGVLGYGSEDQVLAKNAPNVPIGARVTKLAGSWHTCALLDNGHVRCWGPAQRGVLGYGNTNDVGDTAGNTPEAAGDVPIW
jgi:alpha-tubulin suppressor-like RCC1 family protein